MKSLIDYAGGLENISLKLEQVNSLFGLMSESFFNIRPEDVKKNVYCIGAQYNAYADIFQIIWDVVLEQSKQVDILYNEVYRQSESEKNATA